MQPFSVAMEKGRLSVFREIDTEEEFEETFTVKIEAMDAKKTSMSSPRSCCSNEGDSTSLNTTQEDAAYSSSEEDSISLAQRTSKLALSPIRRRLQTSVGSESDSDF